MCGARKKSFALVLKNSESPYVVSYDEMKCFNHITVDAIAVCSHCGKGLCVECAREPANGRMVCSIVCADALARAHGTMQTLFQQGRRNAQASAIYCFLGAVLSGAGAI